MSRPFRGDCLSDRTGLSCAGVMVNYHTSLGTSITRCSGHQAEADRRAAEWERHYPDSPVAPAWFDAADAGERWDED